MHFSTLVTLTLSVFSARAIADNCYNHFDYCGTSLLGIGNYHDTMVQALHSEGLKYDDDSINRSVFTCVEDGLLASPRYCEHRCWVAATGSQMNDTCNEE
ncbi:uncharacterized protein Bfra_005665 [Botrytis fragariae]|uniref:Uncharacterized protein n=1 Tax=Botrytis fragariae TaxID=1964551 RepID=A0A8H6ARP6_9HELO|nr:uncharacterized protein Bfra_005665 [Botrytis fragariae]KAF5872308.1 hypothetical protein Bfra_005665 [Botrytis fragariae]